MSLKSVELQSKKMYLNYLGYKTYPNECFCYENVSPNHFLKEPTPFVNIIWSEKYEKLSHIPYNYKRLDKEGILIETSKFNV